MVTDMREHCTKLGEAIARHRGGDLGHGRLGEVGSERDLCATIKKLHRYNSFFFDGKAIWLGNCGVINNVGYAKEL